MRPGILVGVALVVASFMLVAPVVGATPARGWGSVPAIGFAGVLTITSACALSDSSAPVTVSGSTFTLTGNLVGSLVVKCAGATVNGADNVLVYATETGGNPGVAVTVNSTSSVTVENLVIDNATTGFEANASAGLTLEGNAVGGATQDAVEVQNSARATITNNRLNGSGYFAIYLQNVSGGTISGNNGNGSTYGIEADDSNGLTITRNNDSFGYYGVGLDYTDDATVSDGQEFEDHYSLWADDGVGDVLTGNDANASTYDAIYLDGETQSTATNNASFTDTGFEAYQTSAVTFSGEQAFSAVYAFDVYDASDTLITGTHAPFSEYGVYTEDDNATTILGNDFTNGSDTIYAESGSSNLVIQGNDLANSSEYGVYVDEAYGSVAITGNDIVGSDDVGIYLDESYGPTTISHNDLLRDADTGIDVEDAYAAVSISDNDVSNGGLDAGIYVYDDYAPTTIVNNTVANSLDEAVYVEYCYASTTISGNDLENASYGGVYVYETEGPLSIEGNDISHSPEYAIYAEYTYGPTNVSDNDLADSGTGIELYGPYGPSSIVGNDVEHSELFGIDVLYAYEEGGVQIQANNASGSHGASLNYQEGELVSSIVGNDFSDSGKAIVNDSGYLSIVGNNFLNVGSIEVTGNALFAFYHNDINSSAFNGSHTEMQTGTEASWNAPYPVGGNYWTGYTGKDLFSGPGQNISGSDGIGDTPEPVPLAGTDEMDQYPLTHPWTVASSLLKFTASGLPSTIAWTVSVTFGGYGSGVSSGTAAGNSPVTIAAAYGAATPFTYSVTPVPGYVASPSIGSASTGAGTTSVAITFTPFTYSVSFTESGLSAGTAWSLTVGGSSHPSTTKFDNVSLGNGTYAWTATSSGLSSVSGSVTVNGQAVTVTVAFHGSIPLPAGEYAVVFVEVGVSSGATWSVTFNGSTQSSAGSTIIFSAINGSYSYSVATSGSAGPQKSTGSVSVSGSATEVTVLFGSATGITNSSTSGPSWTELYALVALAVLLAILAVVGWTRSGRRGGAAGSSSNPPPSWSGPTSPAPPPVPPGAGPGSGPGSMGSSPPPPPP